MDGYHIHAVSLRVVLAVFCPWTDLSLLYFVFAVSFPCSVVLAVLLPYSVLSLQCLVLRVFCPCSVLSLRCFFLAVLSLQGCHCSVLSFEWFVLTVLCPCNFVSLQFCVLQCLFLAVLSFECCVLACFVVISGSSLPNWWSICVSPALRQYGHILKIRTCISRIPFKPDKNLGKKPTGQSYEYLCNPDSVWARHIHGAGVSDLSRHAWSHVLSELFFITYHKGWHQTIRGLSCFWDYLI